MRNVPSRVVRAMPTPGTLLASHGRPDQVIDPRDASWERAASSPAPAIGLKTNRHGEKRKAFTTTVPFTP